jgi:raffinose/stachyose/melibiose transport system permease protein
MAQSPSPTFGRAASRFATYAVLVLGSILFLVPVFYVLMTALKSRHDLASMPFFALPPSLHFENFPKAWTDGSLGTYIGNSALISVVKVPLGVLVEALAAFALTRMDLKGAVTIFMVFLVGMMIPMQATLVPLNVFLNKLGLVNTYPGIIFVYIGFGIPFGILILRGFFRTIPKELDEAAVIDGCGDGQRFLKVILPLAKPAVAALFILDFLSTWNEFLLAQIFLTKDSMKTITTGLMTFVGQHLTDYTLLNAGVVLSMIPSIVVYMVFQKQFVSGIAGAVKG